MQKNDRQDEENAGEGEAIYQLASERLRAEGSYPRHTKLASLPAFTLSGIAGWLAGTVGTDGCQ